MSDWAFWAAMLAVALATSVISGILGMAGGLLLLAALLVRLEPVVAIPVHGIVQLVSNASRALLLREHVVWRAVVRFALPLLPAGALGLWLVHSIPPGLGRIAIGVFVLAATWAPRPAREGREQRRAERALPWGGALIGFLSTLIGATGPLLGPFVLALELTPQATIGTLAACQIFQHASKVLLFGIGGFDFARYAIPALALCVAAVIGSTIGTRLIDRVPERAFRRVVKAVITLLAIELAIEGALSLTR